MNKLNTIHITEELNQELIEEADTIPIKWIQNKLIEYVCQGKYSSDSLPIVYSLIADWRKGNE